MRALPATPSLKRSSQFNSPKVEIVIACEGKVTEPQYLEACVAEYSAGMVRLRRLPVTGIPMTIVNAAISERKSLLAQRHKSKDSFDCCFVVWAIFDRDIHPEVEEAIALAKKNKISLAFSDPCFELWPLLHLMDYGRQDDRHKMQDNLKAVMPSYDHASNAVVDFSAIKDKFSDAYLRAGRLNAQRLLEGCENGCPSTTVGDLVKKIVENGKRANRKE